MILGSSYLGLASLFLCHPLTGIDHSEFKNFLASLYDRTNVTTVFMQATAVDMAFQADILTVSPETSLAKFPEIANYPNTEMSKKVASSILFSGRKEELQKPID